MKIRSAGRFITICLFTKFGVLTEVIVEEKCALMYLSHLRGTFAWICLDIKFKLSILIS